MKESSKFLGARGEALAAQYLQAHGFTLLEKNYRWARGEIDIIAEKGDLLIFVEVKTARTLQLGQPITWVDRRKQAQIGRVALRYLQEKEIHDRDCRFDVIGVVLQGDTPDIQHIENAFWLE